MRLVDADSLYKGIEQQECNACKSYNNVKCAACDIADCLRWIDDAPTIEYVTHEQFCNAVNDFFNEFKENGADEETLAKWIPMREILFRGKREDTGEWVYGYYAHLPSAGGAADIIYVPASNPDDSNHTVFVDPETVGQYTGLTDKNGVKIFEGDIVKYSQSLHEVVFCSRFGNAFFGIDFPERGEIWAFSPSVDAERMTVVGNIHDNPELIKEDTK